MDYHAGMEGKQEMRYEEYNEKLFICFTSGEQRLPANFSLDHSRIQAPQAPQATGPRPECVCVCEDEGGVPAPGKALSLSHMYSMYVTSGREDRRIHKAPVI